MTPTLKRFLPLLALMIEAAHLFFSSGSLKFAKYIQNNYENELKILGIRYNSCNFKTIII
jgi:hypothetical protein